MAGDAVGRGRDVEPVAERRQRVGRVACQRVRFGRRGLGSVRSSGGSGGGFGRAEGSIRRCIDPVDPRRSAAPRRRSWPLVARRLRGRVGAPRRSAGAPPRSPPASATAAPSAPRPSSERRPVAPPPPRRRSRPTGRPPARTRTDAFGIEQVWVPAGTFTMGTDAAAIAALTAAVRRRLGRQRVPERAAGPRGHADARATGSTRTRSPTRLRRVRRRRRLHEPGALVRRRLDVARRPGRGTPAAALQRRRPGRSRGCASPGTRPRRTPRGAAAASRPRPSGSSPRAGPKSTVYPWGDTFDREQGERPQQRRPEAGRQLSDRRQLGRRARHVRATRWNGSPTGSTPTTTRRARRPIRPARRPATIKVEKGGWWGSNEFVARSAYRHYEDPPTYGDKHIGFRVASPVSDRTVVAMGGGGFSMEPDNPLLDDHVLDARPGGARARSAARLLPRDGERRLARPTSPTSTRPSPAGPRRATSRCSTGPWTTSRRFLLDQDVVYVGGGNTENMLAIWRVHGVDRALRRAWESGVVMTGLSAGSLCWFETGTTDSFGTGLAALSGGLGFVPGSHSPHYDGEATRRPHYQRLVAEGALPAGYAADDGAALVFDGDGARRGRRVAAGRAGLPRRARPGRRRPSRPCCRRATSADPGARPPAARGPRSPTARTASGPSSAARAGGGRSRPSSPQPGGTSRGARSASGASTNRRVAAAGCGTSSSLRGLRRVASSASIERASAGRSTDEPRPPEDEEVEVELARAPAPAMPPAERALERLERGEQRRARRSPGPGRPGRRARRRRCGTRAGR